MRLSNEEIVEFCKEIDRIETDLRRHEHSLYRLRMKLIQRLTDPKLIPKCGFVEPF